MNKCPRCGRYCRVTSYKVNGLDEVKKVNGVCKKHGRVDLTGSADYEALNMEVEATRAGADGKD